MRVFHRPESLCFPPNGMPHSPRELRRAAIIQIAFFSDSRVHGASGTDPNHSDSLAVGARLDAGIHRPMGIEDQGFWCQADGRLETVGRHCVRVCVGLTHQFPTSSSYLPLCRFSTKSHPFLNEHFRFAIHSLRHRSKWAILSQANNRNATHFDAGETLMAVYVR